MAAIDLPIADGGGAAAHERSDAVRNREKIFCAATRLVAERGIAAVSMDDVARAACVGTGTLYRRFGDRAGLAHALLDEETRRFQNALIGGPPPLGPGVAASERLLAFGDSWLDHLEAHADLLFVAVGHGENTGAPTALVVTHLAILLREAAPERDAEFAARALLDAVSPGAFLFARRRLQWPLTRVKAGWRELAVALIAPG